MPSSGWPLDVAAWLLTYLLHSTLLLAGVWLLSTRRWLSSDALREALTKCALVGGLISATLQTGLELQPRGGRFTLAAGAMPARVRPAFPTRAQAAEPHGRAALLDAAGTGDRPGIVRASQAAATPPAPSTPAVEGWWRWSRAALGAGLLGGVLGLGLLVGAWLRLRARLAGRVELTGGPLRFALDQLCRRAGVRCPVRLTRSERIRVPLAIGILRPEICLPARSLTGLRPAQREAMLAHELAHLVRRDPAWLALINLLEKVFCFQPLHRIARRRWQELAEYRCDAWAARLLGSGLPLARCLTEVAGWTLEPASFAVPRMAERNSSLERRIARLLDDRRPPDAPGRTRVCVAVGLLFVMTALVPCVAAERAPDREARTPLAARGPDRLPLRAALGALERELATLEREASALGAQMRESGLEADALELMQGMERSVRALRSRRERLLALTAEVERPSRTRRRR
ncbi:MAG: M56 family metallopeptidase [Planctomycetota bacterium]|jgi:beta-lactamase regulating signal transducer with metallopeptidase domain